MAKKRSAAHRPAAAAKTVPTSSPRFALTIVLIFCAAILAYLPAINGDFIWDDDAHVTKPELESLHGLWRIWFELDATQQYYPLLHSAFWMEHRLWGDAVAGYHLTNLLLHAGAACLVAAIARYLSLPGASLAGLVFALHPVCVEAVAWISEQKSTLSAVFYLASALVYLHFDQTRRRRDYFLAFALFILALLTKTVTATLPAVLLVVFWWQRGRIGPRRDALPLLPWFAFGAGAGMLTAWVERTYIGAKGANFSPTLLDRVLLAGRVIWFYAGKLVWPVDLTFFYPRWRIDASQWWQYLFPAGVLGVLMVLGFCARRHRGPLAAFLIFAGTLFPALGFFNVYPFFYSYVADHFQYLASLGLIVPIASGLVLATRRLPQSARWLAPASAIVLLTTLAAATWRQSAMYKDSETLYRETVARNPDAWLAHNNLAVQLLSVPGALPEAISHLQMAVRGNPDWAEAHMNLGTALSLSGRLPEAAAELNAALRIDPKYPHAHANLGNVLVRMPGQLPQAIAEYEAALRDDPGSAEVHYGLGNALLRVPSRSADALAHLQAALRIKPDLQPARQLLDKLTSNHLHQ